MYGQPYWLRTMFVHLFLQIFSPDLLCLGNHGLKSHCVSSCNIHKTEGNPQGPCSLAEKSKQMDTHGWRWTKDEVVLFSLIIQQYTRLTELWTNYCAVKNLRCMFASFCSSQPQQRRGLRMDFREGKKISLFSVIPVFFRALQRWRRNRKKQEDISYKIHTRTLTNFKWIKEFIWS